MNEFEAVLIIPSFFLLRFGAPLAAVLLFAKVVDHFSNRHEAQLQALPTEL